MKRYYLTDCGTGEGSLEESKDGKWIEYDVKYEDAEKLKKALEAIKKSLNLTTNKTSTIITALYRANKALKEIEG